MKRKGIEKLSADAKHILLIIGIGLVFFSSLAIINNFMGYGYIQETEGGIQCSLEPGEKVQIPFGKYLLPIQAHAIVNVSWHGPNCLMISRNGELHEAELTFNYEYYTDILDKNSIGKTGQFILIFNNTGGSTVYIYELKIWTELDAFNLFFFFIFLSLGIAIIVVTMILILRREA